MCPHRRNWQEETIYKTLLEGNKEFVAKALNEDPQYFEKLSAGQNPPALWIGCSDSRVPANQITNTSPGDIFVHRNIANVVIHSDMSLISVLDYALNVLKIKHVIICGHYGCGGIEAALSGKKFGMIDNWLNHIKDIYRLHREELDKITDFAQRRDRMVELNVIEGVYNLSKSSIVQNCWSEGQSLELHGWAYSLKTGLITDLGVTCTGKNHLDQVFRFD
ncbi:MAG TPA: carbonate dehydratase [Daejeonella sp.]|nr:carbonate dehydratase [Daejeonella sp.]